MKAGVGVGATAAGLVILGLLIYIAIHKRRHVSRRRLRSSLQELKEGAMIHELPKNEMKSPVEICGHQLPAEMAGDERTSHWYELDGRR